MLLPAETLCKSQESKLAVLWTVGIFALNCGPVLVGFVLDYCGPKFTCIVGAWEGMWSLRVIIKRVVSGSRRFLTFCPTYFPSPRFTTPHPSPPPPCAGSLLNILGLILFGVSQSSGPNAFIPASIFLGLGGITFHLAQMHASALYPRKRGMLTAVFVAGFTGSGIIFYLLLLIFQAAGSTRLVARGAPEGFRGAFLSGTPVLSESMMMQGLPTSAKKHLRNSPHPHPPKFLLQGGVHGRADGVCGALRAVDPAERMDDAKLPLPGGPGLPPHQQVEV